MQSIAERIEANLARPGDLIKKNLGADAGVFGLVIEVTKQKKGLWYYKVLVASRETKDWIYLFTSVISRV